MKKKSIGGFLIYLLTATTLFAQDTLKTDTLPMRKLAKNVVYAEYLGNGNYYTLNYERIFYSARHVNIAGRIGFEYGDNYLYDGIFTFHSVIPIEAKVSLGSTNHHFNIGTGTTFFVLVRDWYFSDSYSSVIMPKYYFHHYPLKSGQGRANPDYILHLGYKYQKKTRGVFFRANLLFDYTWAKRISHNDGKGGWNDPVSYEYVRGIIIRPGLGIGASF